MSEVTEIKKDINNKSKTNLNYGTINSICAISIDVCGNLFLHD
jgi:hypothetical protein